MARSELRTTRGLDRLVFFSDAVAAIAITLLILPLVDGVSKEGSISHLFDLERDRFLAFALSFLVIARFWTIHHAMFERVEKYSVTLLRVNMLWLASVIFLPFPTELLSVRSTNEAGVRFVYIASVLVSSSSLLLISIVIRRSPELWSPAELFDDSLAGPIITVLLLGLALIIGTTLPGIGMWALLLLFAERPLEILVNRRMAAPRGARK